MIERRMVFEIHRLKNEGFSMRKIATTLGINRKTVAKLLKTPDLDKTSVKKTSKLDPFKGEIARLLEMDERASAVVIRQRIRDLGFDGGITIVKDYLQMVRGNFKKKQPFIRFESRPGEQFQVDWGHFGSLFYGGAKRKLYCFAVVECHSRMLYLEFSHSQKQQTLHRCLLNAFQYFGGSPCELVHDNMNTAVIEREGPMIRFNEAYLEFLRPFKVTPKPCNKGKPHEKGKVEKGAIHYIRHNFRPLRSFNDLMDVQAQADHWRDQEANRRVHSTTGERPINRFQAQALRSLPEFLPDCRDTLTVKVHSDFSIRFDANSYTVPPWAIGKQVVVKGDHHTVTVYYKDKVIATHSRCWERHRRIEFANHREAARKHQHKHWLSEEVAAVISLGEEAKIYVERLAANGHPLKKSVHKLLALKDEYGSRAIIEAIRKAISHNAYGADYVENILFQEMTPSMEHPPVRLREEHLNRIRLEEPSLAEYDAFVMKRRIAPWRK